MRSTKPTWPPPEPKSGSCAMHSTPKPNRSHPRSVSGPSPASAPRSPGVERRIRCSVEIAAKDAEDAVFRWIRGGSSHAFAGPVLIETSGPVVGLPSDVTASQLDAFLRALDTESVVIATIERRLKLWGCGRAIPLSLRFPLLCTAGPRSRPRHQRGDSRPRSPLADLDRATTPTTAWVKSYVMMRSCPRSVGPSAAPPRQHSLRSIADSTISGMSCTPSRARSSPSSNARTPNAELRQRRFRQSIRASTRFGVNFGTHGARKSSDLRAPQRF